MEEEAQKGHSRPLQGVRPMCKSNVHCRIGVERPAGSCSCTFSLQLTAFRSALPAVLEGPSCKPPAFDPRPLCAGVFWSWNAHPRPRPHFIRFCLISGTMQDGGPDLARKGCLRSSLAVAL